MTAWVGRTASVDGGAKRGRQVTGASRWKTTLIVGALLLLTVAGGRAQTARGTSIADRLAALRAGSWIQLEGTPQPDGSVQCSGVNLLTGDFLDDDWSIKGVVRAVDRERGELTIAGWAVHVDENTRFEGSTGTLQGLADLRTGMLVEVEGSYVENRGFLAREVDDESDELANRPGLGGRVAIVGRIERVDPRRHAIVALGVSFHVSEKARIRSVIE